MQRFLSRRLLLAGASAAWLVPAAARAEAALTLTDYPLAFLPIDVAGQQAMALLDTGGVRGVQISGNLADTLRLTLAEANPAGQRVQISGPAVRAGTTDVTVDGRSWLEEPISVAQGDIERIAAQIGQPFDAILGWRFLAREGFSADFASGRFSIGAGSGQRRVAFDDAHGVPIGAGRIGATDVGVLIDTGAPGCAIDASLAEGAQVGAQVQRALMLGDAVFDGQFQVRDLSALTSATGAKAVLGLNAMRNSKLAYNPSQRALTID